MLYQPTLKLRHLSGQQYELTIKTDVGPSEGLIITSNAVTNGTRHIEDTVDHGPGGTITQVVSITREQGEQRVEVTVKKDGKKVGDGIVAYDI